MRDPLGTFEANVAWSVGLLEAARLAGIRRFVFASSNAAAGDHPPPSDETDLPHPISPYGASKLAIEAYGQAYAATFGLAACSLRFSNAYGPYSLHKRSVVAAWLRAALGGTADRDQRRRPADPRLRPRRRPGRGGQAVLDAPEADVAGELFQAGTGVETTVAGLADAIVAGRSDGRWRSATARPAPATSHGTSPASTRPRRSSATVRSCRSARDSPRTAAWFAAALEDPALAAVEAHAASGSE